MKNITLTFKGLLLIGIASIQLSSLIALGQEEAKVANFKTGGYTFNFPLVSGWKAVTVKEERLLLALQNKAANSVIMFYKSNEKKQYTAEVVASIAPSITASHKKAGDKVHSFKSGKTAFLGKERLYMEYIVESGESKALCQVFLIEAKGSSVVCAYTTSLAKEGNPVATVLALQDLSDKSTITPE